MALHRFWTILIDKTPTSFRAREKEELLPTWRQLQRTQPSAVLVWCERGKVYASPEEATADFLKSRATKRPRDHRATWRPGGDHKDPKARPKPPRDVRRARFKSRLIRGPARPPEDTES